MYKHYLFRKILVYCIIFLFFSVNSLTTMSKLIDDDFNLALEINKKPLKSISYIEIQRPILEEPPGIQWIKTFGDEPFYDEGYDVKLTRDGGFIITGMTRSYGPDHYEAGWLIKTDSNGFEEWNQTYGEPGGLNKDWGHSVQQTSDSGYVFTGTSFSYNPNNDMMIWLVKTDVNGTEEFNKVYGKGRGFSVQQTKDGGYIVCGDGPSAQPLLLKTDENGNESWRRTYWSSGAGNSVDETIDGGFVFIGDVDIEGDDDIDIFLIKTDRNGTEEIKTTFGKADWFERGDSVHYTDDGGYIIAGFVNNPDDWIKAWLIKTDENGIEVWNRTFGEKNYKYFGEDVLQCDDGGYILTGYYIYSFNEYSSWLIKTDSYGNKIWQVTIPYTEKSNKIIHSVDKTVDGGYILAGDIGPGGIGDALLVKIAPSDAPYNPDIDGPTRGIPDEEYNYTFVTSDPNDEQVYYWIEWGDSSNTGWLGPFDSDVEITESHIWDTRGLYTIKAKAKNINGLESGFSELEVNIPRTRISSYHWLFERFPILERLLGWIRN